MVADDWQHKGQNISNHDIDIIILEYSFSAPVGVLWYSP